MAKVGCDAYRFGPYQLDSDGQRLLRGADPVPLVGRHLRILHVLVSNAGRVVPKEALIEAVWADVAVTDNSLERAVSDIRKALGVQPDGTSYVKNVKRQGYQFVAPVDRVAGEERTVALAALLAPFHARADSRAQLDTLDIDAIAGALPGLEEVARAVPRDAAIHVELAMAQALRFESTRADPAPDRTALDQALHHAREGIRLAPESGEAWSTLAFALTLAGHRRDAIAAGHKAVAHEPDNWRHHVRLGYVSWGEERLRAAQQALALLPDFPLAHWLAATVFIARGAFGAALDHLRPGCTAQDVQRNGGPFAAVGLHLLHGLVLAAHSSPAAAIDEFRRELDSAHKRQLYARECLANTCSSMGAVFLHRGRHQEARTAFEDACKYIDRHPFASVGLAALDGSLSTVIASRATDPMDATMVAAAALALRGNHEDAAALFVDAITQADPGAAGWLLPVEPLIRVSSRPAAWTEALAIVRHRAA
jgi:DNA-binding winged helix-turn-helix (wHTH) protein